MPLGLNDSRRLLMEGSRVFSAMEANGMRLDVDYLDTMIEESAVKIAQLTSRIKESEVWKTWKRVYGDSANLGSGTQLGHIVFDVMGVPCPRRTATGIPATDEEAMAEVDFPFVKDLLSVKKLERARSTNLIGLRREQVDGILRPNFNLHTVISYRSSASDPNSQNIPVRDLRLAKLVRRAFIPRSDKYSLLEVDMSGAEVRVAACYHQDPTMIKYILENHDFHKDLAMQCFLLAKAEVTKAVRGIAKGGFVFASFYGDWWLQICQNLWNAIDRDGLKTASGVPLKEHLRSNGISGLGEIKKTPDPGTFGHHIKGVFDDFWQRRFRVYSQWKDDWWSTYLKNGYFQTLTGFVCRGVYERNPCINYPIQGSSFHCLLWSLIRLHDWMVENKMQSKVIGQIHDSIIMDVHDSEFQDVYYKCRSIMLEEIRKEWDWIIVPLEIEAESSKVNWYEKKPVTLGV